jgi:integrase
VLFYVTRALNLISDALKVLEEQSNRLALARASRSDLRRSAQARPEFAALLIVLCYTGMRLSEALD